MPDNNPTSWPPPPEAGDAEAAKPARPLFGKVSMVAGKISLGLASTLLATFAVWLVYVCSTSANDLNAVVVNLATFVLPGGSVLAIAAGIVGWKTIAGRIAVAISVVVLVVTLIVLCLIVFTSL